MKEAPPFNPILFPDLVPPTSEPPRPPPAPKSARKPSSPRKSSRKAKARRGSAAKASALRFATKVRRQAAVSWQKIKLGITSRLARLDSEKLKRVLVACGIAVTVALLIIALAKLTPLMVALLAFLSLGALLRLWERLQGFPC